MSTHQEGTVSISQEREVNFCCLRHPVYGTLLQQPELRQHSKHFVQCLEQSKSSIEVRYSPYGKYEYLKCHNLFR